MTTPNQDLAKQLQTWLDPLDSAFVECDGMTRLITTLLKKNGIEHTVMGGRLIDHQGENSFEIPHFWIKLPSGHTIDYRARMWVGEEAQHGVFLQSGERFEYAKPQPVVFSPLPAAVLHIMSGVDVESYPAFSAPAPAANRDLQADTDSPAP